MLSNSVANTKLVSNMTLILSFPPGSEPPCGVPGVPGIETETPASRVWGTPLDIEISGGFSIQWIGFVGELLTGNHGFFPMKIMKIMGLSGFNFPNKTNPLIQWGSKNGGTPISGWFISWKIHL
jgi:hypothetical protein